jgi:hypothetical protein
MGHLRSISVLALSLAASGCVLVFDDGGESPDPPPPPPPAQEIESPHFAPALCTGGTPGSPLCPINQVLLDDLGAEGTFEFVLQPVGSGLYFNRLVLVAGSTGLHVERPSLRAWLDKTLLSEVVIDATLDIPPGGSAPLGESAVVLPAVTGVSALSLGFEAYGPLRAE